MTFLQFCNLSLVHTWRGYPRPERHGPASHNLSINSSVFVTRNESPRFKRLWSKQEELAPPQSNLCRLFVPPIKKINATWYVILNLTLGVATRTHRHSSSHGVFFSLSYGTLQMTTSQSVRPDTGGFLLFLLVARLREEPQLFLFLPHEAKDT